MRNLIVLLALLWVSLLVVPVFAQTEEADDSANAGTIVEVLANDPDERFVTLVSAIEAARLVDTFSEAGPFTVFAPTDTAFEALLTELDLTRAELLGEVELLETVLNYHVVASPITLNDMTSSGPGSLTTSQGESLALAMSGATVTVNDATVIESDIAAGNGVIHVIDAVLLPLDIELAATDESVVSGEPGDDAAHLRLAHFSTDTPVVDVFLDDERVAEGLELLNITDWLAVNPGPHRLIVTPANTSIDEVAIGPMDILLEEESWQTAAVIGSLGADTLTLATIPEDYTPIFAGDTRLTVFHGMEGGPVIDLTFDRNRVVVQSLAFPNTLGVNDGAFTEDWDAGTYQVQVIRTGTAQRVAVAATPLPVGTDDSPILIDVLSVEFLENNNYLVAAVGVPAAPELFIVGTAMDDVITEEED